MKKLVIILIVLISLLMGNILKAQNVGIGASTFTPDASAGLEIRYTNKGLLIPRVALTSTTDVTTIPSPANSLLVYNTGTGGLSPAGYYYWDGSQWMRLAVYTGNALGGSGITDYLARWTNATTLGTGVTRDNNSTVGINCAPDASHRLYVNGSSTMTAIRGAYSSVRHGTLGSSDYGVYGQYDTTHYGYLGSSNYGVYGESNTGHGGYFKSTITSSNKYGVYGECANTDYYGYGGYFKGGYRGVYGEVSPTGNNTYYGVYGKVSGGTGTNYGVYGKASGGATNWAGYFSGNAKATGYLVVGSANTSSTTKYEMKEFFITSSNSVQNGYIDINAGTLSLPAGASSLTINKIVYSVNGYHDDGNEEHYVCVVVGGTAMGCIYETADDGYVPVDWTNTASASKTINSSQTVYLRMGDKKDGFLATDNYFYILNAKITLYYSYSNSLQNGDIAASGKTYGNSVYSTQSVGDLAEHFNVIAPDNLQIEPGMIVTYKIGSDNVFELTDKPYSQFIAGVISENPSVLLNDASQGYPVALAGRVKVKVKPSNELIKSGDFLTTSDVVGKAQKATQPGPVIGYAISDQKPGEDFVNILLQPGRFYSGKEETNRLEVKSNENVIPCKRTGFSSVKD